MFAGPITLRSRGSNPALAINMAKYILGIDEAGRGPVVGPMVIAGVLLEEKDEEELRKKGVKDSKLLTHKRRIALGKKIAKIAKAIEIIVIEAGEIDGRGKVGMNLNKLEAVKIADIINKIARKDTKIIVDCPSTNIPAWRGMLKSYISKDKQELEIAAEHKADLHHLSVGAASIIAKVEREFAVGKLKEKLGDFGSGYSSDPITQAFLEKDGDKLEKNGVIRKSWQTWKTLSGRKAQRKLF